MLPPIVSVRVKRGGQKRRSRVYKCRPCHWVSIRLGRGPLDQDEECAQKEVSRRGDGGVGYRRFQSMRDAGRVLASAAVASTRGFGAARGAGYAGAPQLYRDSCPMRKGGAKC